MFNGKTKTVSQTEYNEALQRLGSMTKHAERLESRVMYLEGAQNTQATDDQATRLRELKEPLSAPMGNQLEQSPSIDVAGIWDRFLEAIDFKGENSGGELEEKMPEAKSGPEGKKGIPLIPLAKACLDEAEGKSAAQNSRPAVQCKASKQDELNDVAASSVDSIRRSTWRLVRELEKLDVLSPEAIDAVTPRNFRSAQKETKQTPLSMGAIAKLTVKMRMKVAELHTGQNETLQVSKLEGAPARMPEKANLRTRELDAPPNATLQVSEQLGPDPVVSRENIELKQEVVNLKRQLQQMQQQSAELRQTADSERLEQKSAANAATKERLKKEEEVAYLKRQLQQMQQQSEELRQSADAGKLKKEEEVVYLKRQLQQMQQQNAELRQTADGERIKKEEEVVYLKRQLKQMQQQSEELSKLAKIGSALQEGRLCVDGMPVSRNSLREFPQQVQEPDTAHLENTIEDLKLQHQQKDAEILRLRQQLQQIPDVEQMSRQLQQHDQDKVQLGSDIEGWKLKHEQKHAEVLEVQKQHNHDKIELGAMIANFRLKDQQKDSEILQLRQQHSADKVELGAVIDDLKLKHEQKDSEIRVLHKQLQQLPDVEQLSLQLQQQTHEKTQLASEIEDLKLKHDQKDIEMLEQKDSEISQLREQYRKHKVQLGAVIEDLKLKDEQKDSQIRQLQEHLRQLPGAEQFSQLSLQLEQDQQDKTELGATIEDLKLTQQRKDSEIAYLQKQLQEVPDVTQLTLQMQHYMQMETDLKTQLQQAGDELNECREQVLHLQNQETAWIHVHDKLRGQVQQKEKELNRSREQASLQNQDLLKTKEEECRTLTLQVQQLQPKADECHRLAAELSQMSQEMQQLQQSRDELSETAREAEVQLCKAQLELTQAKLHAQVDVDNRMELERLQGGTPTEKTELEKLRQALSAAAAEKSALEIKVTEFRAKASELSREKDAISKENLALSERLSQIAAESARSNDSHPDEVLEARLKEKQAMLETTQQHLELERSISRQILGHTSNSVTEIDEVTTVLQSYYQTCGSGIYRVDNSQLMATTVGLNYRSTKNLDDKRSMIAQWGTLVSGLDEGDGWLRVCSNYLPTTVHGIPVLAPSLPPMSQAMKASEMLELLRVHSLSLKDSLHVLQQTAEQQALEMSVRASKSTNVRSEGSITPPPRSDCTAEVAPSPGQPLRDFVTHAYPVAFPAPVSSESSPVAGSRLPSPPSTSFSIPTSAAGSMRLPRSGGSMTLPKSGGSMTLPKSGGSMTLPNSGGSMTLPNSGAKVQAVSRTGNAALQRIVKTPQSASRNVESGMAPGSASSMSDVTQLGYQDSRPSASNVGMPLVTAGTSGIGSSARAVPSWTTSELIGFNTFSNSLNTSSLTSSPKGKRMVSMPSRITTSMMPAH